MLVTPSGIAMLFKLLQEKNAKFPIFVTFDGIIMLSKSLQ